ncbi:MAG: hypothetical protein GY794_01660 [bacterium]|nr:hypothetical protein [bacterium]
MRMIAMLRISVITVVLGALLVTTVHAEKPEPIRIPSGRLSLGLNEKDIKQIRTRIEYWTKQLASADTSSDVYSAQKGFLDDYENYDSIRYKTVFARTTAKIVLPVMEKLNPSDKLISLKEINFAIILSRIPQLGTIDAINVMVGHKNPGVRFLAWKGYRGIRDQAIRSRKEAQILFTALKKHAAIESNPLVASVIIDVLNIKKELLSAKPFSKAFDGNFNALIELLKNSCDRLASGDSAWARPCITAIPMLQTAAEFYKPAKDKNTLVIQQLINIAQAGAKAFATSNGRSADTFQCTPLLRQVELAICRLTGNKDTDIRKPLNDKKMNFKQKSLAVRLGVLEWIDRLEELGIEKPKFTPVKAPKPTTQPTTKPAA